MRIINKMSINDIEEESQEIEITQEKIYHCETIEEYE